MYMYAYVYIGNTCLHIVDTVFRVFFYVASMKHPGKLGGGCLRGGSIPNTWSLVPQEKESSSRDMEVANRGSDLWST